MSSSDLSQLGWDLASDGFVGREAAVRQVVRSARSAGVSSIAAGVLSDPQEPEVARMRAFGLVAAALAVHDARPSVTVAAHAA
jgi:hypothetical protein